MMPDLQVDDSLGVRSPVERWELVARESIRDLVARYNANGDTGRFAEVLELFATDAVMDVGGVQHTGHDAIRAIFIGTSARVVAGSGGPGYVRHMTSTHQIDLISESTATGRCYFQVLTSIGLDHWGRYVDEYRISNGHWCFARRRVTLDGQAPSSVFLA